MISDDSSDKHNQQLLAKSRRWVRVETELFLLRIQRQSAVPLKYMQFGNYDNRWVVILWPTLRIYVLWTPHPDSHHYRDDSPTSSAWADFTSLVLTQDTQPFKLMVERAKEKLKARERTITRVSGWVVLLLIIDTGRHAQEKVSRHLGRLTYLNLSKF